MFLISSLIFAASSNLRSLAASNISTSSFSMILLNVDKRDIGRKLLTSVVESFLWIGITIAILFFSGKTPSSNDELHISVKTGEIVSEKSFKIFVGKEDGPVDLDS